MRSLSVAWQLFWYQSKTRQNLLLLLTLFSLAFYLCLLSLGSSSVQQYLSANLSALLGADAVVTSDSRLSEEQRQQLQSFAGKVSETATLSATLTHNEYWQQVEIKLVDHQYPLHGTVQTAQGLGEVGRERQQGPAAGRVWLDSILISKLQLRVGEQLTIGSRQYEVGAVLLHEPDRLLEGHVAYPRVMMNLDDLSSVSNDNNVRYRFLLAADNSEQQALAKWLKAEQPDWQFISTSEGRHPLSSLWLRIEKFVGLSAVLLFVLGAIAVDLIGARLLQRQQHYLAVCLSAGMSRVSAALTGLWLFALVMLVTLVPAVLLAVVIEQQAVLALGAFLQNIESNWQLQDLFGALLLCVVLFALNQLPSWLALWRVSVIDLLQQTSVKLRERLLRTVFPLVSIMVLVAWFSDNWRLTAMVLLVVIFGLAILLAATYLVIGLGEKLMGSHASLFGFALYMMRARLVVKSAQIIGIGLSVILLILCLRMTEDFSKMLAEVTLERDGNLLVSQANDEQLADLKAFAKRTDSQLMAFSTYQRARLTYVNGVEVAEHAPGPSQSLSELGQGSRLSMAAQLPENNQILKGQWHDDRADMVSVEDEVAEDIGLKVGDKLSFVIAGQTWQLTVGAIHGFKPGASAITFWFVRMANIEAESVFHMGSLNVSEPGWQQLSRVWQAHPTLQMMPLKTLKAKVEQFSYTGVAIVLLFNVFISMMCTLVVTASIQGFEQDDRKRNGLMLSFGLPQRHCLYVIAYEWVITGLIASVGAVFGTWLAGELLYQVQFGLDYEPHWLWFVFTILTTTGGIAFAGVLLCRPSLKVSVIDLLNSSGEQSGQQRPLNAQ